ncbi:hypothetical protein A3D77_04705 [Candidatus Gottesmanbacteria bacterium RIFCSPHIGHO2_02_FULL_39_11]|uniref:Uncharacterized protein n=1 Tax=Candidatus Gottesmanbacteria bacterium RIFCSPHIGHO2_02_FULL_39_11 TaxID=1798382 RepID=A0A1F5ZJF0_9BACT|nr:MAG: hypothetical protein A3D77_04705 [Candidatus Gottesmanbacteria bacterium RIFCSPHIGHO2_02_FULL_39_11]
MKKILSILFLLLLPFPKFVHAESNVSVTTESNSNCQTDVKITTNGETKSYHSEDCNQNIDVQSNDGSSKVTIRNQTGTNSDNLHPSVLPTRSVTIIPTVTSSPTPTTSEKGKSILHESFLERILERLEFLKKIRLNFLTAVSLWI